MNWQAFGLLPSATEVTVGNTGEFSTLNEALRHLSCYRANYQPQGLSAHIRILSDGWVMQEQIIANNGIDLSWIEIVSDQSEVTIDRAAIQISTANLSGWDNVIDCTGAFMGANRATLPRLGCRMRMNSTGTQASGGGQFGAAVQRGATFLVSPNCGISGVPGLGAWANLDGHIIAPYSYWDGNGTSLDQFQAGALRTDQQGSLNAVGATIINNPGQGVMFNGGSRGSVRQATITGNGMDGLQAGGESSVHARLANISNNGGRGIYAGEGSRTRLLSTTISGNTGNGIFLDAGAHVDSAAGSVISNNGGYGIRATQMSDFVASGSITVQNNTSGGCNADGGDIGIQGIVSGHPSGKDLICGAGNIQILGALTTTSGATTANNIADSNIACFNTIRAATGTGIFGKGGVSSARGTATVTAAATTVTVTHGLDSSFGLLGYEVQVTPTNSMGTATKFWVSGVTQTQFIINVDQVPGATTATFAWRAQRYIG